MVTPTSLHAARAARCKAGLEADRATPREPLGRIIHEFRAAPGAVAAIAGLDDPDELDLPYVEDAADDLVVIGALHPVLGYLYRRHVDESRTNAPDEYALTTEVATATPLHSDWREHPGLFTRMGDRFLPRLLSCTGSTDERLCGPLESLQLRSGQDPHAFYCWLHAASWIDIAAPAAVRSPVARP